MDHLEYAVILRTAGELDLRARAMLRDVSKYIEKNQSNLVLAREVLISQMPEIVRPCRACGHSIFSHGIKPDGSYDGYGCGRCMLDSAASKRLVRCERYLQTPPSL
jgi:hypothetical protein